MQTMTAKRMENPVLILPDVMQAVPHLVGAMQSGGLSDELGELVSLRASQINGCAGCVYGHIHRLRQLGVPNERIDTVAVWRHSPFFTEKEQAALALTEAATRLADSPHEAVSDATWERAREYFAEPELAALILQIGLINFINRVNVTIQEPAGATW
ncbi:MAG: carboxymuconolactone decarboxylase family protein [Thermomicrobiales bacterium]|nr:carboxymuconolactone decarboxylase family protein [Thermomicrobiales bacterium]MCO5223004.1 carboxymuconolactone decarboxylase family protein [Thermomicrobiales bacterium]